MKKIELREAKRGDLFTLKQIDDPNDNQIWIKSYYDRGSKTYSAVNLETGKERFFKNTKEVYIDFYS